MLRHGIDVNVDPDLQGPQEKSQRMKAPLLEFRDHLKSSEQKSTIPFPIIPDVDSVSPVNRLPPEILGEIFLICSTLSNRYSHQFPFVELLRANFKTAPMVLTHVCRWWREVCLSIPALWSSLSNCQMETRGSDAYFQLWLQRSQNMPLKVELEHSRNQEISDLPETRTQLFIQQAHRWQFASLGCDRKLMEHFLSFTPGSTPLLEGVRLQITNAILDDDMCPLILSQVACLTSIRQLHIACRRCLFVDSDLPFERLTHLCILVSLRTDHCYDILRRCHQAIEVEIKTINNAAPDNFVFNFHPTLPNLVTLTIVTFYDVYRMLSHFTCPSLRRIYLTDNYYDKPQRDHAMFGTFIQRSPHLEQLMINGGNACWDEVMKLLNHESVRRIPDVGIRVVIPRLGHDYIVKGCAPYRCLIQDCQFPHLGWTKSKTRHLCTPLPETWPLAFWDAGLRSEHELWHSREDFTLRVG